MLNRGGNGMPCLMDRRYPKTIKTGVATILSRKIAEELESYNSAIRSTFTPTKSVSEVASCPHVSHV